MVHSLLLQVLGWEPSHTFAGDIAQYYAEYCRLGKDLGDVCYLGTADPCLQNDEKCCIELIKRFILISMIFCFKWKTTPELAMRRHECIQSSHPFMVYIYPTHHLCVGPGPSEACMGWGCTERSHEHGIIAMSKNRDETLQIGICRCNLNIKWMDPCLGMWLNKTSTFHFYNVFVHFPERPLKQQSLQCTISEAIFSTSNLDIQDAQPGDHTYGGLMWKIIFPFKHCWSMPFLSWRVIVASGLKARTIDSNDIGAAFIPIYQFIWMIMRLFFASTKLNRLHPNYEFVKCLYITIHQFVK